MKSLTTRLLAATFALALASGCASVTDAGVQPEQQPVVQQAPAPTPDNVIGGSEIKPIADKPLD
jgi:hypothetical protein